MSGSVDGVVVRLVERRRDGAGAGDGGGAGHPPTLGDPGRRPVRSRRRGRGPARGLGRAALVALGLLGVAGELAVGLGAARGPHAGGVEVDGADRALGGGLADVRRQGDRDRVPQGGVGDSTAAKVSVSASSTGTAGRSAVSSVSASTTCSTTDGRPGPLAADHQPAGHQPGDEQTRPGRRPTTSAMTRAVATATTATLASRSSSSTRRRRRAARLVGRAAGRELRGGGHDGLALGHGDLDLRRGAAGRHDQAGVAPVDRLAPGEHPHRCRRTGRPTGCARPRRGA